MRRAALPLLAALALLGSACASPSGIVPRGFSPDEMPIELERFMGAWYVIAHMPLSAEAEAHDAVEHYVLDGDTIDVRYRFCDGEPDGPLEVVTMTGEVFDPTTNAEWRVRPIWPLRLRYQILELDPDYRTTVVGHPSGRYAWIMAREPALSAAEIDAITGRLAARGYETERMRRVPHAGGACKRDAENGP